MLSRNTSTGPSAPPSRRNVLRGGVAVAAAAGLAGCSSEKAAGPAPSSGGAAGDGPQKGKKVIFVVHDKNAFFVPVQKGFEDMGRVLGWETQFMGPPGYEQTVVVNMQKNAINAKPDGLIFTRIDNTSFDDNIKQAQGAGIQVILSNVASDGYQSLGVGFVGQSFVAAGRTAGQQAAAASQKNSGRKDGTIVITNLAAGSSALDQRGQGIAEGVTAYNTKNGTSFTTESIIVGTDEATAVGKIGARYSRDPNSIVGWAATAFDCQYVATWARTKNLSGKFGVGGFDLVVPVITGIQDGSIDYTIGQNPYAQGWMASALLAQQFDPGYPSFTYDTGAEVVTKTNIETVAAREKKFA